MVDLPRVARELRWWRRREWTDLAFVIGPTMRWVEDDYPRLIQAFPEALLGYQVRLASYETFEREARGRIVRKVIILDDEGRGPGPRWEYLEYLEAMGAKIERWYVHGAEVFQI